MDIELYSKLQNPIEAIDRIGELFARSGMFGCSNVDQGKVLAMTCLTERKTPTQVLREYHIIEGRLSDRADSMLAKFRGKGGKHKVLSRTSEEAAVELELADEKLTVRLTWADAQKEPFVWSNKTGSDGKPLPKKNWATPRARMQTLWARVISDGVRTLAPEIVAGIYTPEELEDTVETVAAPLLKERKEKPANETVAPAAIVDLPPAEVKTAEPSANAQPESEVKTEQAVAPTAPQPAKKFGPADVRLNEKGTELSAESVQALVDAIGEQNYNAALEWLKSRKWITSGLHELGVERARRLIEKPEVFVGYIKGGK